MQPQGSKALNAALFTASAGFFPPEPLLSMLAAFFFAQAFIFIPVNTIIWQFSNQIRHCQVSSQPL